MTTASQLLRCYNTPNEIYIFLCITNAQHIHARDVATMRTDFGALTVSLATKTSLPTSPFPVTRGRVRVRIRVRLRVEVRIRV